jgi:hypothetical protein
MVCLNKIDIHLPENALSFVVDVDNPRLLG